MKKYCERVDEVITEMGGRGKLDVKANGVYEFFVGDSFKEDTISWNGEDFVGIQVSNSLFYIPLNRFVIVEKFV